MTTTTQETIVGGKNSILLIIIMASKGRTDNGTPIQIMEAFLLTITTITFNMQISINMMIVKIHLTTIVHTIMAIKRLI